MYSRLSGESDSDEFVSASPLDEHLFNLFLCLELEKIRYQLKAVKCGASRRTLPLNFFAFRGKPKN